MRRFIYRLTFYFISAISFTSCHHSSQPMLAYRLSLVIDNYSAEHILKQNNTSFPRLIILGYVFTNISNDSLYLPFCKPSVDLNTLKLQLVYNGKSSPVRINTISGTHFSNSGWIKRAENIFVNIVISSKELNNLCIPNNTPAKHIAQHVRLRYGDLIPSESTYPDHNIKFLYYKTSIQYIYKDAVNGVHNVCVEPYMYGYY